MPPRAMDSNKDAFLVSVMFDILYCHYYMRQTASKVGWGEQQEEEEDLLAARKKRASDIQWQLAGAIVTLRMI
jgi:hypothetical protein